MMRSNLLVRSLAVVALLAAMVVSLGAGGNPPSRKIVVFKDSASDELAQDDIISRSGGHKIKGLRVLNAAVVLSGDATEKALKGHKDVLRVEDDVLVYTADKKVSAQAAEVLPWGVNRVDAELAWPTNTGAGIKVAVIDTGISLNHPDLAANIKGGVNTINPRKSATDDNGHGSHVAGTIAAVDNNVGVVGVAPQAYLYAVKVLNANGSGYLSDVIEGIQWAILNGMQVINMSLGTSADIQSFHDAVTAAYNAGIVVVAAAGNSGPGDNTVNYPARYPEAIAVSATDSNNVIASFSSRGTQVELAAPGVSIYSTYKGTGYKTLSGTSMATPHVSGAAALALARGLTPGEVRDALHATSDDLGAAGWDNLYGYGLVDAEEVGTGVQTNP